MSIFNGTIQKQIKGIAFKKVSAKKQSFITELNHFSLQDAAQAMTSVCVNRPDLAFNLGSDSACDGLMLSLMNTVVDMRRGRKPEVPWHL